jgi:SH3-like domain-containing protein
MSARGRTRLGRMRVALMALLALAAAPQPALGQAGRTTGLPLPRFVSLGSDRVNLRFGPGQQYPIQWILAREGLPVEIIEEFDTWRKVRLHDGDQGWIHGSLLSSRRTIVVAEQIRELRRSPDANARVLLRAEPGVIGELLDCEGGWCRIEIDGRRGWLQRDVFWGALPGETSP